MKDMKELLFLDVRGKFPNSHFPATKHHCDDFQTILHQALHGSRSTHESRSLRDSTLFAFQANHRPTCPQFTPFNAGTLLNSSNHTRGTSKPVVTLVTRSGIGGVAQVAQISRDFFGRMTRHAPLFLNFKSFNPLSLVFTLLSENLESDKIRRDATCEKPYSAASLSPSLQRMTDQ